MDSVYNDPRFYNMSNFYDKPNEEPKPKKPKKEPRINNDYGLRFAIHIDTIDKTVRAALKSNMDDLDYFLRIAMPDKKLPECYQLRLKMQKKQYTTLSELIEDVFLFKPQTDFEMIFGTLANEIQKVIKAVAQSILQATNREYDVDHIMKFCAEHYNSSLKEDFARLVKYQYILAFERSTLSEKEENNLLEIRQSILKRVF